MFKPANTNVPTPQTPEEIRKKELEKTVLPIVDTLSILQPNITQLELLRKKGMSDIDIVMQEQNERINLHSFLNALRFIAPIVRHADLLEQELQEKTKSLQEQVKKAEMFATLMLSELGVQGNDFVWLKNSFERFYSEVFTVNATEFKQQSGKVIFKDLTLSEMQNLTKTLSNVVKEKILSENFVDLKLYPIDDINVRLQAILLSKLSILTKTVFKFSFHLGAEGLLQTFTEYGLKKATSVLVEKISQTSILKSEDRLKFFSTILEITFENLEESYKNFLQTINQKAKTESLSIFDYVAKNKDEFNLNDVFNETDKKLKILLSITSLITPKRKGKM